MDYLVSETVVASQKLVRQLKVAPTGVEQVMLAGPGECLTVSAAGPSTLPQTVAVWDLASGEKKRSFGFPRVGRDCYRVAVSPDGALWAWAMTPPLETRDTKIHLCDAVGQRALATLSGHRWIVSNLAFSPTGEHLVSTASEEILIWDLSTGASFVSHGEDRRGPLSRQASNTWMRARDSRRGTWPAACRGGTVL